MGKRLTQAQAGLKHGFRSGLERRVADSLSSRGVPHSYESVRIRWIQPETSHIYTPDFEVTTASGKVILVELKGRWMPADRKKMKQVVHQHPDLDIRMVFQAPTQKIYKGSATTYAQWCSMHLGIPWAKGDVPDAWLEE